MPGETAGARTWLLGAVALWAVVTWILALAGLGGRIERLPADPSLLQPLPTALPAVEGRPGPLEQYAVAAERPLFTTDRRAAPFVIDAGEGQAASGFDYVLTSVVSGPGLQVAIVQPAGGGDPVRLRVGEAAGNAPAWRLSSIEPRRAVFEGPEGQRVLELRVFDGTGGEPPTAMATPPAQARPIQPVQRVQAAPPGPGQPSAQPGATAVAGDRMGDPSAPSGSGAGEPAPAPAGREVPASPPSAVQSPEAQVEAIRRRIEERRARLREQARQGQSPDPD